MYTSTDRNDEKKKRKKNNIKSNYFVPKQQFNTYMYMK